MVAPLWEHAQADDATVERLTRALGLEPVIEAALDGGPFDARELEGGLANVLMVGHEPVFSGVVHELTGARVVFKKGGVAAVERDALVILLRPAELRAIAGTG